MSSVTSHDITDTESVKYTDDEYTAESEYSEMDDESDTTIPEDAAALAINHDPFLSQIEREIGGPPKAPRTAVGPTEAEQDLESLFEEASNAPLPDSEEDDFDELEDADGSQTGELENGEEKKKKKAPITFGVTEPPSLKDARKKTTILSNGKFARDRNMTFVNWNRIANRDAQMRRPQREEEEEEEEAESYAGMEFTGRNFTGIQFRNSRYNGAHFDGTHADGSEYGGERREYNSHYRHHHYRPRREQHQYRRIAYPYNELLNTEDAETMMKNAATFDPVIMGFANQHSLAIPEELVWISFGKHAEFVNEGYVCPFGQNMQHHPFTEEELECEASRNSLVYDLICEKGPMHIEDLWRAYLDRQTPDKYPFDGFTGFHRFIFDRVHIFMVDQQLFVYNQNLLVTTTVLRYTHSLYHNTPVERTSQMFKKDRGMSMFFRAFLCNMSRDDLSFDQFFQQFPSLFKYDDEWVLNEDSVYSIPSAFNVTTLPRRHQTKYVDRSQIFSGVGKVTANNVKEIKIESEETLRREMVYLVGVPINIVDDPEKYPIGTRVKYTGVRWYNATVERVTVQGTSIGLHEEEDSPDFDGTVEGFWTFDEDDEEEEEKSIEKIEETPSTTIRILDMRQGMAEREKECNKVLLKLTKDGVNYFDLFQQTKGMFKGRHEAFEQYIADRPYLFIVDTNNEQPTIIRRPREVTKAMLDLLIAMEGKEGRSMYKHEAATILADKNAELKEEDQFTLEDLKQIVLTQKSLQSDCGKPRLVYLVKPLVHWDHEHKIMLRI